MHFCYSWFINENNFHHLIALLPVFTVYSVSFMTSRICLDVVSEIRRCGSLSVSYKVRINPYHWVYIDLWVIALLIKTRLRFLVTLNVDRENRPTNKRISHYTQTCKGIYLKGYKLTIAWLTESAGKHEHFFPDCKIPPVMTNVYTIYLLIQNGRRDRWVGLEG